MINILLFFILSLGFQESFSQSNIPPSENLALSPFLNARMFYKHSFNLNVLTELERRKEANGLEYKHLRYGLKYRFHDNFKFGIYLKHAYGIRNDNDWVKNVTTGEWQWIDASSRLESLILTEVTSRLLLDQISLTNFMFEFRVQHNYNINFGFHMLKIRPSLTYFWFKNTRPFINLYVHNDIYVALNFHETAVYENWLYVGLQYHYANKLKLGLFVSEKSGTWTTSQEFLEKTATSYSKNHSASYLGFNINYYY